MSQNVFYPFPDEHEFIKDHIHEFIKDHKFILKKILRI